MEPKALHSLHRSSAPEPIHSYCKKKKYCCLKFLDISSQVEGFSIIDISVYILLLKICLVSIHMQMCCAYRCPHTYTHELCLC